MSAARIRVVRWIAAGAVVATATALGGTAARAVIGGEEPAPFAARIVVGDLQSGCSGALVAPQWALTAKVCLPGVTTAGPPPVATTAQVGDRHLPVLRVVPHADRDLALLRLGGTIDAAPVRIATTPPAAGDRVRVLGFGRTDTQWVPDGLRGAEATVGDIGMATVRLSPAEGDHALLCKGDAGGPTVRGAGSGLELNGLGDLSADFRMFSGNARVFAASGWTEELTPRLITGDFDGDGRTDLIGQRKNGDLYAYPSSGVMTTANQLFPRDGVLVGSSWTVAGLPRLLAGDFNGDGRTDLAGVYVDGAVRVFASTGTIAPGRLFAGAVADHRQLGLTGTAYPRLLTGDFDGDGRTDLIAQTDTGRLHAWRSTGDFSGADTLFAGDPIEVGAGFTLGSLPRLLVGDFNGDGRDDLAGQLASGKLRVWASRGTIAPATALWALPPTEHDLNVTTSAAARLFIGDADRDGRDDLIVNRTSGDLEAYASTGALIGPGANTFPATPRLIGRGWAPGTFLRVF